MVIRLLAMDKKQPGIRHHVYLFSRTLLRLIEWNIEILLSQNQVCARVHTQVVYPQPGQSDNT